MWISLYVPSFHHWTAKAAQRKAPQFSAACSLDLSLLGEVERHDGGSKQNIFKKTGDPNNIKKNKWIERYKEGKSRNKCWLFLIVGTDHYYNRRRRDLILTKSAEKLQEVSELGETGHPEEFRYKPPSIGETRHPRRKCFSVQSTINSDIHLRRVHSRPNFR